MLHSFQVPFSALWHAGILAEIRNPYLRFLCVQFRLPPYQVINPQAQGTVTLRLGQRKH